MKKVILIFCFIVCFCISCHKDDNIYAGASAMRKCVINMIASIDRYDANTKSSEHILAWENGAQLFLNFYNDGTQITGIAEYNSDQDIWVLSYKGTLKLVENAKVSAHYFTNYDVSSANDEVILSPESAIYADIEGTYSFLSDGELKVTAHLTPAVGRIRFKGDIGANISIQGISTSSKFITITQNVVNANEELKLCVGNDGYTPYVYGTLNQSDKKLILYHEYCRYEKLCSSNVLNIGKSGVMDIPNQDVYSGWELIPLPPTIETLQPSNVYDKATLNGRLLSNGGDRIVEYGFFYGTSEDGLSKYQIEGDLTNEFSYTIPVTSDSTYYYQAYAVNSFGNSLGEIISFTPPSDVPTVITTEVSRIYHISGSRYRCNFYGKITNLNNSSLLDYGFEVDREVGWYSQVTYISLASNSEYHGFYGNTNTDKIEVDIPFEFAYTLYFESNTDYPVLRVRAYARNKVGGSLGEQIEQDVVW